MNPAYLSPLANHLWQSTLFAGIAGLLTLALRNNGARVRYWVWLAASWKFLVPFSVLISLGGQIQWRTAPPATQPTLFVLVDQVSQPFSAPASLPAPASATLSAPTVITALLWIIWACGFTGISCSWWIRWRRIRAAVRAGSPTRLEIPIKALCSPTLLEPGVFGIFRPVLLLPEGIFDRVPPEQLKGVIAHELCHVYHRDNLTAAIHMFVETVFWFHPMVWWIGKRMIEERERACDEEVLRLGSDPRDYANGIISVCRLYAESQLVCMSGATSSNLNRRIEEIMSRPNVQPLSAGRWFLMAGAALLTVIVPVLTDVMSGPALQAQSPAAIVVKPSGPKFEVVSIKQAAGINGRHPAHVGIKIDPSRVDIGFWSIKQLILRAYGLPSYQLSGPEWISSLHFDVVANFPEGATKAQLPQMLQWLLADRFGLVAHSETRDLRGFALMVAKGGPKMKPAVPDPDDPASQNRLEQAGRTLDSLWSYDKPLGLASLSISRGVAHSEFKKMPLEP